MNFLAGKLVLFQLILVIKNPINKIHEMLYIFKLQLNTNYVTEASKLHQSQIFKRYPKINNHQHQNTCTKNQSPPNSSGKLLVQYK